MDNIQAANEPKSVAVVRNSHSHPFIGGELYRRETIDFCIEVVSIRMTRAENRDLVAFSP